MKFTIEVIRNTYKNSNYNCQTFLVHTTIEGVTYTASGSRLSDALAQLTYDNLPESALNAASLPEPTPPTTSEDF